MTQGTPTGRVLARITKEDVTKLASGLVDIPSPPGHERRVGEFIIDYLDRLGIETVKQVISDDRINAVGILKGAGDGASLSFNGHMDTSFTGSAEDLIWITREAAESSSLKPKAYVEDDCLYGLGIGNMKAGLAAFLTAAKALKDSDVQLKGNAIFAAVVGETARAPIDEYRGQEYEGGGYGTRYLVARGVISDYAVCCDGSNMALSWVQAGVAYLKITTYGHAVYVPFAQRDMRGRQSVSALAKMDTIINHIEDWAADYEKRYNKEYDGLVVAPKVCIGCIRAGAPYRPSVTPGRCSIYVDVRTPPDVTPLDIKNEIQKVIERTGISAEVRLYRSQMGYIAKGAEELIKAVDNAQRSLTGKPVEKASAVYNSMWTDMTVYNEIGIPCVKIGPSSVMTVRDKGQKEEGMPVRINQMVHAAKLYAMIAMDMCNREKKVRS